jgi:predicted amidohydrolase YtcJ
MHGIRAALSLATEVNWIGTKSVDEALELIRIAAADAAPAEWIIVAGGWPPLAPAGRCRRRCISRPRPCRRRKD